ASVTYEMRPTGGGSFTTISSSTTAPFDGSWNTTGVSTGDYDLRPVIADRAGNTFTGATVTVHVDVTAPTVALANPGSPLAANEPVTPTNVKLDGGGTVAPVVSGTHVLYNTGSLAVGSHTLTGGLTDASGKWSAFRVSFAVWTPSSGGTPPPVEGGTSTSAST